MRKPNNFKITVRFHIDDQLLPKPSSFSKPFDLSLLEAHVATFCDNQTTTVQAKNHGS